MKKVSFVRNSLLRKRFLGTGCLPKLFFFYLLLIHASSKCKEMAVSGLNWKEKTPQRSVVFLSRFHVSLNFTFSFSGGKQFWRFPFFFLIAPSLAFQAAFPITFLLLIFVNEIWCHKMWQQTYGISLALSKNVGNVSCVSFDYGVSAITFEQSQKFFLSSYLLYISSFFHLPLHVFSLLFFITWQVLAI